MSNSSLATARYPAHTNNYYGTRYAKIDRIIVHHMAAVWTAKRCAESFQDPNRGASANYCIGNGGEIAVSVDEELASGCSSSEFADRHGVTIETSNSEIGGTWKVSDNALQSLIKLCADIAKRNGLGKLVVGENLCWHQMYAATACPGEYLLSKMNYICEKANEINYPKEVVISMGEITSINGLRTTDALVLITDGRTTTGFNKWGTDVVVGTDGKIKAVVYGKSNTAIPTGCICLSGHGKNSKFLLEHCEVGAKLKLG